jgi:hypothetical protein
MRKTEFHIVADTTPRCYRADVAGETECIILRFGTESRIIIFPSGGVTIEDLETALAKPRDTHIGKGNTK